MKFLKIDNIAINIDYINSIELKGDFSIRRPPKERLFYEIIVNYTNIDGEKVSKVYLESEDKKHIKTVYDTLINNLNK
jgi:hypothetical protein